MLLLNKKDIEKSVDLDGMMDQIEEAYKMMIERGYQINNVDSIIVIEKPKMAPYLDTMRKNIAQALHTDETNINVKATCAEGLGFVGEEKGVLAQAVVMLVKNNWINNTTSKY